MFEERPKAFVALPRGGNEPELRAVIETTLDHHKVGSVVDEGALSPDALDRLRECDLMIADITGSNPNIMMEVGMALGMGKRVILLSQDRSGDLPFDVHTQQVAVYTDVTSVGQYLDLWLRDVQTAE